MKRFALLFLLLAGAFAQVPAWGQTTSTYTGLIQDLAGNPVTAGQVTFTLAPSVDSTISGTARFVPTTVTCPINGDGSFSAQGGGQCTVRRNTAISPGGTSYKICIQADFQTPGSCFYDYATTATKDISTPAPTLATGPTNYGSPGPPTGTTTAIAAFIGTSAGATSALSSAPGIVTDSATGSLFAQYSQDFVDPLYAARLPYPIHQTFRNTTRSTFMTSFSDLMNAGQFTASVEHGWHAWDHSNPNLGGISLSLTANTPVQLGGGYGLSATNYSHSDNIGISMDILCTGTNASYEEACKSWRVFVGPHGDNWGITAASVTVDGMGQTVLQGTSSGGYPAPLTGHNLRAAAEDMPIIDITLAKTYSTGNVQSISNCPSGVFADSVNFICITGDSATGWSAKYGATSFTTTTAAIGDPSGSTATNVFKSGPVAFDVPVASLPAACMAGALMTTSGPTETSFDQIKILSVNTDTPSIHAYLNKPLVAGAFVGCGGAIGHAFSMRADDVPIGTWNPNTAWGDITNNASIYRLALPIVGSAAGNILILAMNDNGLMEKYGTQGFQGTQITTAPTLTATYSSGAVTSLGPYNSGNGTVVMPSGTVQGGGVPPPLPTITFGAGCTAVAHFGYVNGGGQFGPQLDAGGTGCSSSTPPTISTTVLNPYAIYPGAYTRSNFNPSYSEENIYGPKYQSDPNQVISKSTAGYMTVGGAIAGSSSDGFSVGDAIEGVYTLHHTVHSQELYAQRVMVTGQSGPVKLNQFAGIGDGSTMGSFQNVDLFSKYFGTPASHWGTDNNGNGGHAPPIVFPYMGPFLGYRQFDSEPMAYANRDDFGGFLLSVTCNTPDMTAPCHNGNFSPYYVHQDQLTGTFQGFSYNPVTRSYEFDASNGSPNSVVAMQHLRLKQLPNLGCVATDSQGGAIACPTGVTGSIGGSALTVGTCASGTAFAANAIVGHPVAVSDSTGALPNALVNVRAAVTSTSLVTVQVCPISSVTPAATTYNVTVF